VSGNNLTAFYNGNQISVVSDSSITAAGQVGVRGIGRKLNGTRFDNFSATALS
jgi:hypothetical protein